MNKINEIFDKVYVVSYEGSPRLANLDKRLAGLDYEVFYGVNKKDLDINQLIAEGYSKASPPCSWSVDVFACGFSHTKLWQHLRENNLKNTLILEDDVIMLEKNIDKTVEAYKQLPDNWDVFFIGMYNGHGNYDDILPKNYNNVLYRDGKFKMGDNRLVIIEGTNAYAVHDNKFLDILLERQLNPETCLASEFWPEFHLMEVFACTPQVFPQIDGVIHFYNEDIGRGIDNRYN